MCNRVRVVYSLQFTVYSLQFANVNKYLTDENFIISALLCEVLPNVPQSRLKNQPRLETVGLGVTFHQEELFIFHSTLTELHVKVHSTLKLVQFCPRQSWTSP